MREYELLHIPTPSSLLPFSSIINNQSLTTDRQALVEFELNSSGDNPQGQLEPSPSNHVATPLSTTIVINEKPFLHKHRLRIGTLIEYFTLKPYRPAASDVRQLPDMKLKQRWILLIFILVCVPLILILSTVQLKSFKLTGQQLGIILDLAELTERDKCPACFGVNLCPAILNKEIELNDWNKFAMSRIVNVKNVYYATWRDAKGIERQIVLKKLGHDEELERLDKLICAQHHGTGRNQCDVSDTVIDLIEKYKLEVLGFGPHRDFNRTILNGEQIVDGSDILLCPSHRKTDFLLEAGKKRLKGHHHNTILANVLTMLLLNPEPLLLQAFPQSGGWPFPSYYGACGRLIAEEYVGSRLTTFVDEPFSVRASLAKQLLEMAAKFYDNPTNFVLYFTDISPDNFAVEEKTGKLRAIDLGNFIVVDKEAMHKRSSPGFDKLLQSESMPCEEDGNMEKLCLGISTEDLCIYPHTDHNYYAICAGLLAEGALAVEFPDGLLHSVPAEFSTDPELKNFSEVLLKCKDPKIGNPNLHYTRIEAASELIRLLDIYLKFSQQNSVLHGTRH